MRVCVIVHVTMFFFCPYTRIILLILTHKRVSLSLHELCHQLCYFHPCRSYLNPSWEIFSDFAGFVK